MNKTEFYADLNRDFQALMAGETSFLAMISNTSALLFERLEEVNWAADASILPAAASPGVQRCNARGA